MTLLQRWRDLRARMPRCRSCGKRVPCPTSTGECIYCWNKGRAVA